MPKIVNTVLPWIDLTMWGPIVDQLLCDWSHVRPAASNVYVGIRLKTIIHPCNLWHRYEVSSERSSPMFRHLATRVHMFHMIRKTIERTFRHTGSLLRFFLFLLLAKCVVQFAHMN